MISWSSAEHRISVEGLPLRFRDGALTRRRRLKQADAHGGRNREQASRFALQHLLHLLQYRSQALALQSQHSDHVADRGTATCFDAKLRARASNATDWHWDARFAET